MAKIKKEELEAVTSIKITGGKDHRIVPLTTTRTSD